MVLAYDIFNKRKKIIRDKRRSLLVSTRFNPIRKEDEGISIARAGFIMLRCSVVSGRGRLPNLQPASYARWLRPNNCLLRSRNLGQHRAASTVTNLENFPNTGETSRGFTVQEKKHIPELHLTAVLLRHDKTNADYLHIAREDTNNVFGIGFKTNPPDATGVPHILEHTTLCGSEK